MRAYLKTAVLSVLLYSCGKSESIYPGKVKFDHNTDTIGATLIIKGASFNGSIENSTILFNDGETKPAEIISDNQIKVTVPINARTGVISVKTPKGTFTSADTFYVRNQAKWKQATPFPGEGRILATAFVIGTKAYVTTGSTKYNSGIYYNDLWEYDIIKDKWTRKADMPGEKRYMAFSFVIGNKGYVGGGILGKYYSGGKDLYQYTPENDSWAKMADAEKENDIYYGRAVSYQGKGYVLSEGEWHYTMVYDPTLNTWTRRKSINNGTYSYFDACAFVLNNNIYYGFGTAQIPWSGSGQFINGNLSAYDDGNDQWTFQSQQAPSQDESVIFNAYVYKNEAYVSFGDLGYMYAYNPLAKTWRPIVHQAIGISKTCSTFMLGSRCYAIFGHKDFYDAGSNKLWMIDVNIDPFIR